MRKTSRIHGRALDFRGPPADRKRECPAFTLIELLSVMAVMLVMSVIAVSSYFGITRGSGMRIAASHLRSVFLLARQSAIMNGKKACVIVNQDEKLTNTWFVLCSREGTVSYTMGAIMMDDYATWTTNEVKVGGTIYNLDTGQSSTIVNVTNMTVTTMKITTESAIWTTDAKYGWAIYPKIQLPLGYQFYDGTPPFEFRDKVTFNADGTRENEPFEIDVYETIRSAQSDPHVEITVAGLTGFVSVNFK